jgi:hypothetical protein
MEPNMEHHYKKYPPPVKLNADLKNTALMFLITIFAGCHCLKLNIAHVDRCIYSIYSSVVQSTTNNQS